VGQRFQSLVDERNLPVMKFNIAKGHYQQHFDPYRSFHAKASSELGCITYWLDADRSATATDPRDKVYAILGIVDSLSELTGHPSYDSRELIINYNAIVEAV
jgi:hypothetical protein